MYELELFNDAGSFNTTFVDFSPCNADLAKQALSGLNVLKMQPAANGIDYLHDVFIKGGCSAFLNLATSLNDLIIIYCTRASPSPILELGFMH